MFLRAINLLFCIYLLAWLPQISLGQDDNVIDAPDNVALDQPHDVVEDRKDAEVQEPVADETNKEDVKAQVSCNYDR